MTKNPINGGSWYVDAAKTAATLALAVFVGVLVLNYLTYVPASELVTVR